MDTRLLRTFRVLARTGSFTATAAELHLVQSTVTTQIKSLEHDLGAKLVDRLPGGAELTEAGVRVLAGAHELLAAEQRLRDAARSTPEVTGDVRLGAPESMCAYRLPRVVADLAGRWPGITVHLTPVGTPAALDGVRDGVLDVALVLEDEAPVTSLDSVAVGVERIDLVAAPGHPDEGRYFLLEEGCSYTDRFARGLSGAHPTRFGSIEAARSCVVAGLGLSVLPRVAVADQLAAGTLRSVAELPVSTLFVVTDPRRTAGAAVRVVCEALGHVVESGPAT
ncbi:LysR family transcriptional regulator [Umezawaea tangerina]|uniref:DNA-binding transcriptional LysR family regulator n=1 Tax=Umezawaea tangerina TaxID=84725 RepID=A0A2T0TLF7_9PSEU|nr:LysR family transcriptional regulator [Umezawaea tangerina]PRY46506.1 DNA-binding transcriptional LysR family regulator [Umezawaea tangerina]